MRIIVSYNNIDYKISTQHVLQYWLNYESYLEKSLAKNLAGSTVLFANIFVFSFVHHVKEFKL